MALTQISTAGVKDDAVTSGKIPANAVGSSELADNAVDTAAIADDAVTSAKIADGTIVAANIANDTITAVQLANNSANINVIVDGAVSTAKIADGAVTLAKLPHGDTNNDGKFLRANNGADPTFETVTGTTINNNADNRVITGSGTANTLEGEANLTYDGSKLTVQGDNGLVVQTATAPSSNTDPAGEIFFNNSSNNNVNAKITTFRNTGTSGGDLAFFTRTHGDGTNTEGEERMRIDSSGNILCVANGAQSSLAPFFISVIGKNAINYGGGTNDTACLRIEDKGTNNNYYHGIELRTKRGGDVRMYAHDQGDDTADLVFALDGGASPAEKIRMLNTGGITFNGDTAAANALDDYEEGTFNAGYHLSNGTQIASADGRYTKIGNRVIISVFEFVGGQATKSDKDMSYITDLPFTGRSEPNCTGTIVRYSGGNNQTIGAGEFCYLAQGGTQIKFDDTFNTGTGNWTVSLVYEVA